MTLSATLWIPLTLVIAGCGDRSGGCTDAACRQANLIAAYEQEDPDLPSRLLELEDPVEQVALVRHFVERGGADLAALCAHVPEAGGLDAMRDACGRMSVRPHLQRPVPETAAGGMKRAAAGPAWAALRPAVAPVNPWEAVSVTMAPCADPVLVPTCQHQAALAAAARGDGPGTASACMGIPAGKWRHECFFDAVKSMVENPEPARVPSAIALCWGTAPGWLDLCLERAITDRNGGTLPQRIPPADEVDHPGWAMLRARAEAAHQAIAPLDPLLARASTARFWARVAAVSVHRSVPPSMAVAASLPPEAAPHFRAALAWQRWQLASGVEPEILPPESQSWAQDRSGEEGIDAVVHFYGNRRALAADPEIDAIICRLEAAGRDSIRGGPVLRAALGHESALVRWTATRLIESQLRPDSVPPGQQVTVDRAAEKRLAEGRAKLAAQISGGE